VALTTKIAILETRDVAALTAGQLFALSTAQIQALTPDQVGVLTMSQLQTLNTAQSMALTATQLAALTTTEITYLALTSPIDLNGDGIKTLSITTGVQFDWSGSGQKVQTGWIDPADGLLVLDRNQDGLINDGTELFGTSTILPSGEPAANGYAALQALDTNSDGVISHEDTGWADLQVWTDKNSDGVSQAGELTSLDSLGIAKLDLAATSTPVKDNGNWVGLTSSFEKVDGATHDMADVWFVADKAENAADLRTQVNRLVQEMASFDNLSAGGAIHDSGSLTLGPSATQLGSTSVAVSVGEMVGVLRQFDQNGMAIRSLLPLKQA
jgi:hypothetical protein